jgi:hypothetical protein
VVRTVIPGKLIINILLVFLVSKLIPQNTKDFSIFQNIHTSSAAHPEFIDQLGIYPGGKIGRGVKPATNFHTKTKILKNRI